MWRTTMPSSSHKISPRATWTRVPQNRFQAAREYLKPIFSRWSKRVQTLGAQMLLVTVVLLANVGLTVYANVRYPSGGAAVGLLHEGGCDEVGALDSWLHVLISVLSMLMLSASNFCMQLQVSPTRTHVDAAHAAGRWVDVGLHTVQNMRHVRGARLARWVALALTSVPINML